MSFLASQQLNASSGALLVGTVLVVGVLHTIVPDHWVPITLVARQRNWSRAQTARAALLAGTGHVATTLILAALVWLAGVAVAAKFGHWIDTLSSAALIIFGLWIAIASWRDLKVSGAHAHGPGGHVHDFSHLGGVVGETASTHGPELQRMFGDDGALELSIFEAGQPPRFRFTTSRPALVNTVTVQTIRAGGRRQSFHLAKRGDYWESLADIPEPHGFDVNVILNSEDTARAYQTRFEEHVHGHVHDAPHRTSTRTPLLLILGSSPMVEGIPAFFAAGKYGPSLIVIMATVFALSTILTYVLLCVLSTAGLQRVKLGKLERYGEVMSGGFIAAVGLAFWLFPVL